MSHYLLLNSLTPHPYFFFTVVTVKDTLFPRGTHVTTVLLSSVSSCPVCLPRKDTMAAATGTRGCPTCPRSASTSTARPPPSRTRPARTSSPRTSRLPTSPSPTSSPGTLTPTWATPSTSTPCTSRRRRTSSSGPAARARMGWARTHGADWRVRSWAWMEAPPGWGGKASAGRSCSPRTHTASSRRWSGTAWGCTTWATDWRMFKWVDDWKLHWELKLCGSHVCACVSDTIWKWLLFYWQKQIKCVVANKIKGICTKKQDIKRYYSHFSNVARQVCSITNLLLYTQSCSKEN